MADSAGTGISDSLSSQPEAKREQFRSTFLHVAPSMFLGAIDQTIIAAALPAIAAGSCRVQFRRSHIWRTMGTSK